MAPTDNCTKNWHLLPPCVSLNGRNRSAPIAQNNKHVKLLMEETTAPFGINNFNADEKIRMNLDLSCTESMLETLAQIDAWALAQLAKDTKLYFKKELSESELRSAYRPCATPHERNGVQYAPTVRAKVMLEGPNKIRVWGPNTEKRDIPVDFRICKLTPQLTVKSLWLMNGSAGVLFECHDLVCVEEDISCPF